MNDKKDARKALMRPAQLLGIAFACALFAGFVTAMSTGIFQGENVWVLSLVVTGVVFIAVALGLSILLLAIDPAEVTKTIDKPVLLSKDDLEKSPESEGDDA